jgi:hypothetical protein
MKSTSDSTNSAPIVFYAITRSICDLGSGPSEYEIGSPDVCQKTAIIKNPKKIAIKNLPMTAEGVLLARSKFRLSNCSN